MKDKILDFLKKFSFKTGIIVLGFCVVFYIISFAQMLLPISTAAKTVLWTIFFGMAKAAQYSALAILGTNGIARLKSYFKRA